MDQALAPQVSVLMAVHNGQEYLRPAIDCLLAQTFRDFELIVVDDASTDGTAGILASYRDPRIRVLKNTSNAGLAASLNRGVKECRATFIARMDSDDIAEPRRLEAQLTHLQSHPEIGVLGSAATIVDEKNRERGLYLVQPTHTLIKWRAFFGSPMIHPSVMVRREVLRKHPYNETFRNSQDYELWSRLLFETDVRFENLTSPLLRYRVHGASTTARRDQKQKELAFSTSLSNIRRYISLTDEETRVLRSQRMRERLPLKDLWTLDGCYRRLADAFVEKEKPSSSERKAINRFLARTRMNLFKYWIKTR